MKAAKHGVLCLLMAAMALGQARTPPATPPTLKTRPSPPAGASSSNLPADAPVATVQGLCERPPNSSATPADCETVITRAQFEKAVNAVQPNMPAAQRKDFAERYIRILIFSEKAHELGLDVGPDFDEQMYLARIQLLAKLAVERIQKESAQVTEADIEDYYKTHAADFRTVSFERLYVPKQKQIEGTGQKPNDPDIQKKREASESEMKQEADKLHERAVAGEDFAKLQQEAYDLANYKVKAQNPRVDNARKNSIPATDLAIFDLKKGEVSPVFNDPTGFLIYKIQDKQDLPVASVREEIARSVVAERTRKEIEELQGSIKTTLDESYFATPAPPSLRNPNELPVIPQQQPTGNK